MRIAYITAGAGGMMCGSCLHDNTLAAALQRAGHDVALVPCYTPLRTDETPVSMDRVFYGAVRVWLSSRYRIFRRPWPLLDRLLDHPALLRWIARRDWSTSAEDLGLLTLSVLRGEEGGQRRELDSLAGWLGGEFRPDTVHLTNSMLLGMAAPIGRATGAPVICSVQGEDLFLDAMIEPYRSEALALMRRHASEVALFVATSPEYSARMQAMLGVPPSRMAVVPLGLNPAGHDAPLTPRASGSGVYTIGYLARLAPEKGLGLLADAFHMLARRSAPGTVRLRVAGHLRGHDREFYERVREGLLGRGLGDSFEYVGEVDRQAKIDFLRSLDVLSVPALYREPKGLYALEAMANGVPVVEPGHGVFPGLIADTGGGVLFEPGSAEALCTALEELRRDPEDRLRRGARGREAVLSRHTDDAMARATLEVYRGAAAGGSRRRHPSPEA
jgi:glycosyltransferase involved in cell wall biosynthesis